MSLTNGDCVNGVFGMTQASCVQLVSLRKHSLCYMWCRDYTPTVIVQLLMYRVQSLLMRAVASTIYILYTHIICTFTYIYALYVHPLLMRVVVSAIYMEQSPRGACPKRLAEDQ